MGGEKIDVARDFRDLLRAFVDHDVRFLIVGAYALAVLGRPRATGDLDVWVEPTPRNARKAYEALHAFGAPLHELTAIDLATPGVVFQIGLPPLRIDLLTEITGLAFAPCLAAPRTRELRRCSGRRTRAGGFSHEQTRHRPAAGPGRCRAARAIAPWRSLHTAEALNTRIIASILGATHTRRRTWRSLYFRIRIPRTALPSPLTTNSVTT